MNLSDINKVNYYIPNNYEWKDIIINTCNDWKNVSTYAHSFYIKFFYVYVILGIIKKFYNPHIKFNKFYLFKTDIKIINKLKLNYLDFDIKPIEFLQNLSIWIILSRIFFTYYTIKLYLGGL